MERVRGPVDAAMVDDGEEVLELPNVHAVSVSPRCAAAFRRYLT